MTAGVVTGEAVRLDVRLAHWPSRLLAKIIDTVVQYVLFFILLLTVGRIVSDSDEALASAVVLSIIVFVFVGYSVILETVWRGRTLGKAALGLRVVRDDGGPERFRHALVRGVMFPLESWGPALIAMIVSKRGKRFGDMLAGTIVVQERVPGRTAMPSQMPPALAWWAATLDLSRFGDDLALACRQFLGRQGELTPTARDAMGGQLVAAVSACVTPAAPPGTPGWAYLSAVLAERRRREEMRMQVPASTTMPPVGYHGNGRAPSAVPSSFVQPGAFANPAPYSPPPAPPVTHDPPAPPANGAGRESASSDDEASAPAVQPNNPFATPQ